jgi:[FeFe] hydrogenase H-cluster maturation GTPase HydF
MNQTPKSNRLHLGFFGRTNVGKSSVLNYIAGQDVAITSPVPGTTTDVVEKPFELLPLGPVLFLDTAGVDDSSDLGTLRLKRTRAAFDRSDVAILVTEPEVWGVYEQAVAEEAAARKTPLVVLINKIDEKTPSAGFLASLNKITPRVVGLSCLRPADRERAVAELKDHLIAVCPEDFLSPPPILGDLVPSGGVVVLVAPQDKQAPKGRLILPQAQAIRDALDHGLVTVTVQFTDYAAALKRLTRPPDLVVCDSQVVEATAALTPPGVPLTTFSILFARAKGDLAEAARGARAIAKLKPGDRVLVSESCSHHAMEDDIGRVKLPRWLTGRVGGDLKVDVCSGRDFPANASDYRLVLHCGGCMLSRREMLSRQQKFQRAGVPVTNYGVAISALHGVAERVLSPFPTALAAYRAGPEAPCPL